MYIIILQTNKTIWKKLYLYIVVDECYYRSISVNILFSQKNIKQMNVKTLKLG